MNKICTKKLYEKHGFFNHCRCPHCQQAKDQAAALDYYRQDQEPGANHCDPFPERKKE